MYKLDENLTSMIFGTYTGGDGNDIARGLAVDGGGMVTFSGESASSDFPTTPGALQTSHAGGGSDAFVTARR